MCDKIPGTILVQQTPNPNARKFVLPQRIFAQPQNFANGASAAQHPLATQLFALPGVYNVFWVQDFVTINKQPDAPWDVLERATIQIITNYLDNSTLQIFNNPSD